LRDAGGNITHAARALGMTRHGLKKRMLRLGLRVAASDGEHS
jgi:transcriptional regulator with GAF, ATPase, and Fis domain